MNTYKVTGEKSTQYLVAETRIEAVRFFKRITGSEKVLSAKIFEKNTTTERVE